MDQILTTVILGAFCLVAIELIKAYVCLKFISEAGKLISGLIDKMGSASAVSRGPLGYTGKSWVYEPEAEVSREEAARKSPRAAFEAAPVARAPEAVSAAPPSPLSPPLSPPPSTPPVNDSVNLIGVDDPTAAMIMGIIANEMGRHPDELRFISIKAC